MPNKGNDGMASLRRSSFVESDRRRPIAQDFARDERTRGGAVARVWGLGSSTIMTGLPPSQICASRKLFYPFRRKGLITAKRVEGSRTSMIRFLQKDNRLTKALFVVIIAAACVSMVIYLIPGLDRPECFGNRYICGGLSALV